MHREPAQDDNTIAHSINTGDISAFESLYRTYVQSLTNFATIYLREPDLAADIVDEVFMGIWMQRTTWNPEKGIARYLRGAVRNRVRNYMRDSARSEAKHSAAGWSLGAPAMGEEPKAPDAETELRDTMGKIWRAVDNLPEMRRLVVALRWQQQLDISEIAEHLGIAEGAVRVHLSRGLADLRRILGDLVE